MVMNKSWMLVIVGALLVAEGLATPARAQSTVVYAAEYNQSTNRFGTIDLLNGNFTRIASVGKAKINDIAYCPTNGTLYGISNTTALVTFNKTNGAITKIANLSTNTIQSLAFRPSDGKLFGATQNRLYTINPTNGTATLVGNYGNAQQPWQHRAEHPLRQGRQSLRQQYQHKYRHLPDQHREWRCDLDG